MNCCAHLVGMVLFRMIEEKNGGGMMGADVKEMIADTTRRLLTKKRRGKLTVMEIVEECNITRQAFYYHFEDVPAY